jgi:hypothetical protein
MDVGASPCGAFNEGGQPGQGFGVPNKHATGTTTNPNKVNACVAWLGKSQPGINTDPGMPPYEKPYSPQVCQPPFATSSQDTSLCDPSASSKRSHSNGASGRSTKAAGGTARTTPSPTASASPQLPQDLPANPKDLPQHLQDLLGIGGNGSLPDVGGVLHGGIKHGGGGGGGAGGVDRAANDLLDFLFAP